MCLIVLWLFIVDFVELKLLRFAQAQADRLRLRLAEGLTLFMCLKLRLTLAEQLLHGV